MASQSRPSKLDVAQHPFLALANEVAAMSSPSFPSSFHYDENAADSMQLHRRAPSTPTMQQHFHALGQALAAMNPLSPAVMMNPLSPAAIYMSHFHGAAAMMQEESEQNHPSTSNSGNSSLASSHSSNSGTFPLSPIMGPEGYASSIEFNSRTPSPPSSLEFGPKPPPSSAWSLHDHEEQTSPSLYNSRSSSIDDFSMHDASSNIFRPSSRISSRRNFVELGNLQASPAHGKERPSLSSPAPNKGKFGPKVSAVRLGPVASPTTGDFSPILQNAASSETYFDGQRLVVRVQVPSSAGSTSASAPGSATPSVPSSPSSAGSRSTRNRSTSNASGSSSEDSDESHLSRSSLSSLMMENIMSDINSHNNYQEESFDSPSMMGPASKRELYKTEMCRGWTTYGGKCRYGKKCLYAHGIDELRAVMRGDRFKSEPCKYFHTAYTCCYGIRCTYLHEYSKSDLADVISANIECVPKRNGRLAVLESLAPGSNDEADEMDDIPQWQ